MADERTQLEPIIHELLALFAEHAHGIEEDLTVQRAASRLVFEAYRVGVRSTRSARSSSLSKADLSCDEISGDDSD